MSNYQYYEYQPGNDDGGSQQDNGYNPYTNQYNGQYQQPQRKPKRPHPKAKFVGKVVAAALIFGAVAGPVTAGTNMLTNHLTGNDQASISEDSSSNSSNGKISSTTTSASATDNDVSALASEALPSIVQVTNMSLEQVQSWFGTSSTVPTKSLGSGIIISEDDKYLYIATNNHVVSNSNSLSVTFNDNKSVSGEVVGTDVQTDLAVIKVKLSSIKDSTKKAIKVATLGSSENLKVGQQAIVIGNALGYGQSVTTGVISALNREVSIQNEDNGKTYTQKMIQTSAAVNAGNSGGALLNSKGEVIGIVSAKYSSNGSSSEASVEGMGFAIPISNAKTIIDQLMTSGKVTKRPGSSDGSGSSASSTSEQGFLGIQGADISSEMASSYNMPQGVYVTKVVSGSPAEKAGIKKGDVITAVDGTTITSMQSLASYISGKKKGDKVKVSVATVENDYKASDKTITLTARPDDDSSSDDSGNSQQGNGDNSQNEDGQDSYGNLYDWSQIFGG
ncbi:MAG: trypsin-like peptidase domain-containing protein [Lachnospiraceae bacterium]|nr:trypsin-like peptidase domain-containing protein [Lachnospiraceae bacterium]